VIQPTCRVGTSAVNTPVTVVWVHDAQRVNRCRANCEVVALPAPRENAVPSICMRGCIVLALCCSCRIGFDAVDDGGLRKPSSNDAVSLGDSPPGSGSYTVVDTTAPFVGLADAPAIPGFIVDADDENFAVTLPFPFVFYRVTYDQMIVNVNGYVAFTTSLEGIPAGENQCPFTTGLPDAMIALFWDDLWATTISTPYGTIVAAVGGDPPNRTYTVEWRDMDAWYAQGNDWWNQGMRMTQQLVLHESGEIVMHYGPRVKTSDFKERDCGLDRHRGCSATIGLEGAGGAPVTLVQCGTAAGPATGYTPIDEGRLLHFTPQ
jgi:hypothetical protein